MKPTVLVLFGITGDLARNKVLPALYHLYRAGSVHEKTYIVGTSRQVVDSADIVAGLQATLPNTDPDVLSRLQAHLSMVQLDPTEADGYDRLSQHITSLNEQIQEPSELFFYLSLPPQTYGAVIQNLGQHKLNYGQLMVEKPFGYDLGSAEQLINQTAEYFKEDQIYRIDHYLAKETAQNILTFRSQNPLFRDIWNNRHITKVSITAAESIGIEGRANFYDNIGALRDVVQSHLLQLLSVTLMHIPETFTAESVHECKQSVLDALQPIPADNVNERAVRGQYNGYRAEVENAESTTETFASVTLFSNDPKWQGVELKLTNGKNLKIKRTSITVDFGPDGVNRLQFRIQPNEGITLKLRVKRPGLASEMSDTTMEFDYKTAFQMHETLDAYERVLIDAMRGDRTLFATDQEVLASWRVLQPVLDAWGPNGDSLQTYEVGSDGPPC